jgi:hypothetical protein
MLDPLACQHVSEAPKPRLSVDALVALRDLLDQHPLLPATSLAMPGASQLKGDSDAHQSSISPLYPEPATLRPPHRVAAAPHPQRRQCHELLTQLLAQVIHGESIQERSHEHQD